MKEILVRIWRGWKKAALGFARFQTVLLLTVLYFVLLAPLGALMKLFGWDPLESRSRNLRKPTNWKPSARGEPDVTSLRRQS